MATASASAEEAPAREPNQPPNHPRDAEDAGAGAGADETGAGSAHVYALVVHVEDAVLAAVLLGHGAVPAGPVPVLAHRSAGRGLEPAGAGAAGGPGAHRGRGRGGCVRGSRGWGRLRASHRDGRKLELPRAPRALEWGGGQTVAGSRRSGSSCVRPRDHQVSSLHRDESTRRRGFERPKRISCLVARANVANPLSPAEKSVFRRSMLEHSVAPVVGACTRAAGRRARIWTWKRLIDPGTDDFGRDRSRRRRSSASPPVDVSPRHFAFSLLSRETSERWGAWRPRRRPTTGP